MAPPTNFSHCTHCTVSFGGELIVKYDRNPKRFRLRKLEYRKYSVTIRDAKLMTSFLSKSTNGNRK